jgi:hypothetical protein
MNETGFFSYLRGQYLDAYRENSIKLEMCRNEIEAAKIRLEKQLRLVGTESDISAMMMSLIGFLAGGVGLFIIGPIGLFTGSQTMVLVSGFMFMLIFPVLSLVGSSSSEKIKRRNREAKEKERSKQSSLIKDLGAQEEEICKALSSLLSEGLDTRLRIAEQNLISGNQDAISKKEFVESSRALLSYKRGGEITVYDESAIQNNLAALTTHSGTVIHGDNFDNRTTVCVDKIDHSNTITLEETGRFIHSEAEAKREVIRIIHQSAERNVTLIDLLSAINTSDEMIRSAVNLLCQQGIIIIGNRDDGSICYKIDYLAS